MSIYCPVPKRHNPFRREGKMNIQIHKYSINSRAKVVQNAQVQNKTGDFCSEFCAVLCGFGGYSDATLQLRCGDCVGVQCGYCESIVGA